MLLTRVIKTKKRKNMSLFSLALFSLVAVSCGKVSTSSNNNIPSGGGDTIPENTLSATLPPPCDKLNTFCTIEELKPQTKEIAFAPSSGSITSFKVTQIDGASSEWVVDDKDCSSKNAITQTCQVKVTYSPVATSKAKSGEIVIHYTYTDNKGKQITTSLDPMKYQSTSLLSTKLIKPTAIKELSNYSQITFSTDSKTGNISPLFGLSSDLSSTFYDFNNRSLPLDNTQMVNRNYTLTPSSFGNFVIYANKFGITYLYNSTSQEFSNLTSPVNAYAITSSVIYGADLNGNVYSIQPDLKQKSIALLTNYTSISQIAADSSKPYLYTMSNDGNYEYICGMNTNQTSTPLLGYGCISANLGDNIFYQNIDPKNHNEIAVNGVIYLQRAAKDGTINNIHAYAIGSLDSTTHAVTTMVPLAGFKTIDLPLSPTQMTYDSKNNILYVVVSDAGSYKLLAYNASTGQPLAWDSSKLGLTFSSASKPFITDNGSVVIAATNSKYGDGFYGFTSTGDAPFISGYHIGFPQAGFTPALQLSTLDSTTSSPTLDIPATSSDGSSTVVHTMNLAW